MKKIFLTIVFFLLTLFLYPTTIEATLLGRLYIQDPDLYPTCANNKYYLGDNCGNTGCMGGPNYTVTWIQNSNTNSITNNECWENSPRYTFENTAGPFLDADGELVDVIIVVNDPNYLITKWIRGTSFSDGSDCGKPGESGTFPTASNDQTIANVTLYEDGDCRWNHFWFYTEPVTISGKVTSSSANPLPGVTINQGVTGPYTTECNLGTATTDVKGDYLFPNVPFNKGFCLRPPAIAGYVSPPSPASYECQTAGKSLGTVPCATGSTLDQSTDNAYNFVYSLVSYTSPNPPSITSLQIGNANPNQTNGFTGINLTAGLQQSQGGLNWLNPMKITVNASPGSGSMKAYYIAFYDKTKVSSVQNPIITDPTQSTPGTPNTTLQATLQADPSSGFIAAYDPTGQYYIWNPNTNAWTNITGSEYGQQICGSNCSTALYYTAFPGDALNNPPNINLPNTWTILYDRNFGTKTMYTGVQVVNTNNLTTVNPNASPIP